MERVTVTDLLPSSTAVVVVVVMVTVVVVVSDCRQLVGQVCHVFQHVSHCHSNQPPRKVFINVIIVN